MSFFKDMNLARGVILGSVAGSLVLGFLDLQSGQAQNRFYNELEDWLAETLVEMEQDVQSSISYAGGKKLMDIRKVNYVTLGGDNAGEHLLM